MVNNFVSDPPIRISALFLIDSSVAKATSTTDGHGDKSKAKGPKRDKRRSSNQSDQL
jgi:hypothetical protein